MNRLPPSQLLLPLLSSAALMQLLLVRYVVAGYPTALLLLIPLATLIGVVAVRRRVAAPLLAALVVTAPLLLVFPGVGSPAEVRLATDDVALAERFGPGLKSEVLAPLLALTRSSGTVAVGDALEQIMRTDPARGAGAHDYMHAAGQYSLTLAPSPAAAYKNCDLRFNQACGHGVVMEYLTTRAVGLKEVPTLCEKVLQAQFIPGETSCWHALGHAFSHAFDWDYAKALRYCDALDNSNKQESCWDGAFMENIVSAMISRALRTSPPAALHQYLDAANPLFPCPLVASKYWSICYRQAASQVRAVTNGDLDRAVPMCDAAPAPHTHACYLGLGQLTGGISPAEFAAALPRCQALPLRARDDCLVGTLGNPYATHPKIIEVCAMLQRAETRPTCAGSAGYRIGLDVADPKARSAACATLREPVMVQTCNNTATSTASAAGVRP